MLAPQKKMKYSQSNRGVSETCRSRYTIICGCIFLVQRKWKRESTTTKKKNILCTAFEQAAKSFRHSPIPIRRQSPVECKSIREMIYIHSSSIWNAGDDQSLTLTPFVWRLPQHNLSADSVDFDFSSLLHSINRSSRPPVNNHEMSEYAALECNLYFLLSPINVPGCLDDYRDT